jgi:hypothetical protein
MPERAAFRSALFYLLRGAALSRFRLAECVEEDDLRGVRCGRDFVAWALDRLVANRLALTNRLALNGRTTLLASATITPNVEPIFLATPSSRVSWRFSDIRMAPFSARL